MSRRPVKHSVTLKGHRTSISLEDEFWAEFRAIAAEKGWKSPDVDQLVERIAENLYLPVEQVSKGTGSILIKPMECR